MKIDSVTGALIILFVGAYILAGQGAINLGSYTTTILVVVFFTLFTFYDQFKRPHMERNYIYLFAVAGLYLGAVIGYLVTQDANGALLSGGIGLIGVWIVLYLLRKPFYAWLDKLMGQGEAGNSQEG
jgi:uncharacterized membrane protein YfcA